MQKRLDIFFRFLVGIGILISSQLGIYAQSFSKIDSLKQVGSITKNPSGKIEILHQLSAAYMNYLPEEGIQAAQQALTLSIEEGLIKEIAESRELLGTHFLHQQKYMEALKNFDNAAEIYKSIADWEAYWKSRNEIGWIFFQTGDYPQALTYYLEALKYYEDQNNSVGIAKILNRIGIIYHRQLNAQKAIETYQKAIGMMENEHKTNDVLYAHLLTNLGLSYMALDELEKAEQYYLKSQEINTKIGDERIHTVNIGNLAAVYASMGAYQKAESYFKQAAENSKKMGQPHSEAINYGDLGVFYIFVADEEKNIAKKNKYLDLSIENLEKSLETLIKYNDLRNYQLFSKTLSDAYEQKGDYLKALNIFKTHVIYKDSVFNNDIERELSKRELEYNFSKREDSIRIANEKDLAVKDALLSVHKNQRSLLLTGLLLLSIIGVLLIVQNRNRKARNRKLSKLNQDLENANWLKARFFSIISHDLRSPISNIITFIRLGRSVGNEMDEPTRQNIEQQTLEAAENLLKTIEDLLTWSKSQLKNVEPEFSELHIDEIFDEFKKFYQHQREINFEFVSPANFQIFSDPNYLKTIIRNLTSNSIKAMDNIPSPTIRWEAFERGNSKVLQITDNGPGALPEMFNALFDETHPVGIQNGLGLHLVREMAHAVRCKIELKTGPGKGSQITLVFDSVSHK